MTEKEYLKVKKLTDRLMSNSKDIKHNLEHTQRVRLLSHKIVDYLGLKSIDRDLLDSICLLHDITYIRYSSSPFTYFFEGYIAKHELDKYLRKIIISPKERQIIINAISKHPHSFPFGKLNRTGNVYTKILQDADTIDLFSKRRLDDVKKFYPKDLYNKVKIYFGEKLVKWGMGRVERYLNYPQLKFLLKKY